MTTGMHIVRDISCIKCGVVLGWKYAGPHLGQRTCMTVPYRTAPSMRLRSTRRATSSWRRTSCATQNHWPRTSVSLLLPCEDRTLTLLQTTWIAAWKCTLAATLWTSPCPSPACDAPSPSCFYPAPCTTPHFALVPASFWISLYTPASRQRRDYFAVLWREQSARGIDASKWPDSRSTRQSCLFI
jgi:hypothetical protein